MKLLYMLLVIFITGCAATRLPVEFDSLDRIDSWSMKGRLAARIGKDGGSASFIWSRNGDEHFVELYGPLGAGRIVLSQSQGRARLIDNKTEVSGENLEDVLFKRVGWLIPFNSMNYWVIGRPQPGRITSQKYENDRLVSFVQSGWAITYNQLDGFSETAIPSKITMTATPDYLNELSTYLNREIENVRVKFIIKEFVSR